MLCAGRSRYAREQPSFESAVTLVVPIVDRTRVCGQYDIAPSIGVHVYDCNGPGSSFTKGFSVKDQPSLIPQNCIGTQMVAKNQIKIAVIVQVSDGQT